MAIAVVPYDPRWPDRFEAESVTLEGLLGPWLTGGVHHIGSTSVPGLSAKPIIDMMAGIKDLAEARAAIPVLEGCGYEHAPHRPEAHWFRKPASPRPADLQLHLTEPGSDLWRERLTFRDALRADRAAREQYEALKLRLAPAHGDDLRGYTDDKRAFVAGILAAHGLELATRPGR
jgi:GrpB-like predicted nucleotidyltransferase (UPF0157 family)